MSRLAMLKMSDLNAEQKRLHASLTGGARATAPRKFPLVNDDGSLNAPFNALLYTPALGDASQKLGGLLRFDSQLPGPLREIAILTVARHWRANYEWFAHAPIAEAERVDVAAIDAIKAGKSPEGNEDRVLVHRFVSEFLETGRVGDKTYVAATELLGRQGTVELTMLAGYYCMISAVLNVFEVELPEGEEPPFGNHYRSGGERHETHHRGAQRAHHRRQSGDRPRHRQGLCRGWRQCRHCRTPPGGSG